MRRLVLLVWFCCFLVPLGLNAQGAGVSVTCDNGATFDNGVEIIVTQMRSGFTYTATAIGLNGFDPVLAVLDETRTGLCSDDDSNAAGYTANLPTTGQVPSSGLSSQVFFSQNSASAFADISLVVGGFNNATGEFLLILEGMGVTSNDGAGDAFAVRLTPNMVASGVPLSVYMISRTADLDPFMFRGDENLAVISDDSGDDIYCDDAGNTSLCYGQSSPLSNSFVSTAEGQLPGFGYDSMLSLPLAGLELNTDPDFNFYNFIMTSYNQQSQGQYVLAFHVGTAPAVATNDGKGTTNTVVPTVTPLPQTNFGSLPAGVSVTCEDGASFDNGVEIIVNQMRSGFTYTATAVGIGGFDPVLAVLDETGTGLCSDDEASAARYAAILPTTGQVPSSGLSAQVAFDQNSSSAFADVSLVVGGFGNTSGEFLLILEGMAATAEDGAGDAFSVRLTPGMVQSGIPLTLYMITRGQSGVDPLMFQADADLNVLADRDGVDVVCDDAGNPSLCYGESFDLSSYSVTINTGTLPGWQYDAMLSLPLSGLQLNNDSNLNFDNFVMTSFQQQTEGQYLLVFHIGMTEGSSTL
jgi:hypothetical protein